MAERKYPEIIPAPLNNGDRADFRLGGDYLKPQEEVRQEQAAGRGPLAAEWIVDYLKNRPEVIPPENLPPVQRAGYFSAKASWNRWAEIDLAEKGARQTAESAVPEGVVRFMANIDKVPVPGNIAEFGRSEEDSDTMWRAA